MKYNSFLVKAEGVVWSFNNLNKAMDFVRTMLLAEGEIVVAIRKVNEESEVEG